MARRNIYEGHLSCYALNEGVYVPGDGVNLRTGVSILALILRDLRRGWSYDHSCKRIPFDTGYAEARIRYLYPLCIKHTGGLQCEELRGVINYALRYKRIDPLHAWMVTLAGPNARKVLRELVYMGILPAPIYARTRPRTRGRV